MKKKLISVVVHASMIICFSGRLTTQAQTPPAIIWDKTYGGTSGDALRSLSVTSDGGYLLGGFSNSGIGADKSETNRGSQDYWVVKTDADGNKQFDKTYGGSQSEWLSDAIQASDGNYLIGGYSYSPVDGDKTQPNHGVEDWWVVKTDNNGNKIWDKDYGSNSSDLFISFAEASDGGYLLFGSSNSMVGFDKSQPSKGGFDYWIIKINANGVKQWDKVIGGNKDDYLGAVLHDVNGGYFLAGQSLSSASGDKSQDDIGSYDIWLVKIDDSGNKLWDRTYGGVNLDVPLALAQSSSGDLLIGTYSDSKPSGDKSEGSRGFGTVDYWILKTDASGNKIWDQTIGSNSTDYLTEVKTMADGTFLLGGYTQNVKASYEKTQNGNGWKDMWLVKVDDDGKILWDKTIGGTNDDDLFGMVVTNDNTFTLAGSSSSQIGGDKTAANKGQSDYWLLSLGCSGTQTFYIDNDLDGFGTNDQTIITDVCEGPEGYSVYSNDCNDSNQKIRPNAIDNCNGIDDNCDGIIDENAINAVINPSDSVSFCTLDHLGVKMNVYYCFTCTYQWQKNGVNIPGATLTSYQTFSPGTYQVTFENNFGCSAITDPLVVTKFKSPKAKIVALGNLDICQTGAVTLHAIEGSGYTYQWKNPISNIEGATNSSYVAHIPDGYRVWITAENKCRDLSNVLIVYSSCKNGEAISNEKPEMNIYPNPSSGKFQLSLNSVINKGELTITNFIGQEVFRLEISGTSMLNLDFNNWEKGIYMVKLKSDDETITTKWILQ